MSDDGRILIAAAEAADGEMLLSLLRGDFPDVRLCTDSDLLAAEFEEFRPWLLLLAFPSVDQSERHYRELLRDGGGAAAIAHRAIVLCGQQELERAYTLCRRGEFDDYVLFWPTPPDRCRLLMSVQVVLRCPSRPRPAALGDQVPGAKSDVGPTPEGEPATASSSDQPVDSNAPAPPLVLVVEDDLYQQRLLRQMLRAEPVQVEFAISAAQCMKRLEQARPGLILMDITLPDMNGIDLTRQLRSNPEYHDIPVVMLTGHGQRATRAASQELGVEGYLIKPVALDDLKTCLREHIA